MDRACECSKLKSQIAIEIYRAFKKYGAMADILCIIGSYGDTLEDEKILSELKHFNEYYETHPVHRFDYQRGAEIANV